MPSVRLSIAQRNVEAEQQLVRELGIPALVAAILVRRGLGDPDTASAFLDPSIDALGDPRLLPDYAPARDVLLGAIERKEKIFIHGDYDVDGVTSAALFSRFLEKVGADVHTHVPHRMKEGYGIHLRAVEAAREMGAKVFLTCDCGISAHEQVDAAREAGMTVVVTDHHTVPPDLPEAAALINPHRSDSSYPFRELSGAGVVFRFCEGLAKELDLPISAYRRAYLDLAVLGTVADVMPLVGENRIITKHGLKHLWETKKEGLKALMKTSNLYENAKDGLLASHISFQIAPRLNATGRIDDAARALDLLLSRDEAEVMKLAGEIEHINRERRAKQDQIVAEAMEMVAAMDLTDRYAIVVGNEGWHSGIVGLVASKLVEAYHRPSYVMVINPDTGMAKGSARSIPGFNLAESIRALAPLIEGGGHAAAAGFSTEAKNIPQVVEALNEYAKEHLTEEELVPVMEVDALLDASEVTFSTVESLQALAPFGNGNPTPILAVRDLKVLQVRPTKNERVAQMCVQGAKGPKVWSTTFRQAEAALASEGSTIDAVIKAEIDSFNGTRSLKFVLEHFQPSEVSVG